METIRAHIIVRGRVQGVAYRAFAQDAAQAHRLSGWVRNLPDGAVEAELEGPQNSVQAVIEMLRRGPQAARVQACDVQMLHSTGETGKFEIRR